MPRKTIPLSNVDAAWLSMDDPTNLMMITGVMTFRKPLDMNHLLAVAKYRWLKFDRMRMRVVKPTMPVGKPYWEIDPYFDLDAHIRRVALPAPGDHAALQRMVSDLMSTPLDASKPLWQMHVVENYGDGCALITRIHHSIADGLALVYVLLSLTDVTPDAPWPEPPPEDAHQDRTRSPFGGPITAVLKQGVGAARTAGHLSRRALQETRLAMADSNHALELLQAAADAGYAASRLLLRTSDPQTPFKGQLGVMKRGAWSRPLPLKSIKSIKNATRTTVNDVLVAAITGSLRRYILENGGDPADFRAVVPVNLRTPEEMGTLGNKFGLVFLSLPLHEADPLQRLVEVNRRMGQLKDSSEATVALGILSAMGLSPAQIQSLILTVFAQKATGVLTNVPGPPMPLFLAGREIEDIMFWVPQAGRLGLGISILSYAGRVYLGVVTDEGLVPDPERLIEGFYEEYDLLLGTLGLAAAPAPQPRHKAPEKPVIVDDLTKINGIGNAVAALLQQQGITSYRQLAQTRASDLRSLLDAAGPRYASMDPSNWPAQARYLDSLT